LDFNFLSDLYLDIQLNADLSEHTTFKLGGPAKAVITAQTPYQLEHTITRLAEKNIDFILIGGGSNLLISDKGLKCVVVRYAGLPFVERDGNDLVVAASTMLDSLAQFALAQSLEGLNYTSGIPGTVGGAIVGNAGAFGKQVGDVLHSVLLIDKNGKKHEERASDLGFKYRHSNLKERGDIILGARFRLTPANQEALVKERDEILSIRREKHPDLRRLPCAGSFFRNIEPTSAAGKRQAAGWFLEEAGAKKMSVGGASVFEKHANIIVKSNGCLAQDVYDLSNQMAQAVYDKFNLALVREVRLVGQFQKMPESVKTTIW